MTYNYHVPFGKNDMSFFREDPLNFTETILKTSGFASCVAR